jgi:hypothetical protein
MDMAVGPTIVDFWFDPGLSVYLADVALADRHRRPPTGVGQVAAYEPGCP